MAILCGPLESSEIIYILRTKFVEVWGEEELQSPAGQEEVGEVSDCEILSNLKKELVWNLKNCHIFFTWLVFSSYWQVLGLAFCNMLALIFESLDTCFKRVDLVLWTET